MEITAAVRALVPVTGRFASLIELRIDMTRPPFELKLFVETDEAVRPRAGSMVGLHALKAGHARPWCGVPRETIDSRSFSARDTALLVVAIAVLCLLRAPSLAARARRDLSTFLVGHHTSCDDALVVVPCPRLFRAEPGPHHARPSAFRIDSRRGGSNSRPPHGAARSGRSHPIRLRAASHGACSPDQPIGPGKAPAVFDTLETIRPSTATSD